MRVDALEVDKKQEIQNEELLDLQEEDITGMIWLQEAIDQKTQSRVIQLGVLADKELKENLSS